MEQGLRKRYAIKPVRIPTPTEMKRANGKGKSKCKFLSPLKIVARLNIANTIPTKKGPIFFIAYTGLGALRIVFLIIWNTRYEMSAPPKGEMSQLRTMATTMCHLIP